MCQRSWLTCTKSGQVLKDLNLTCFKFYQNLTVNSMSIIDNKNVFNMYFYYHFPNTVQLVTGEKQWNRHKPLSVSIKASPKPINMKARPKQLTTPLIHPTNQMEKVGSDEIALTEKKARLRLIPSVEQYDPHEMKCTMIPPMQWDSNIRI